MAEGTALRRRPELACTRDFSRYQREWFAQVRERALAGEPFAVLSADSPHEIYRAMNIPYVVLQWWSSIIAAKQRAPDYLAALAAHGYPDDSDQYNSLALGELLSGESSADAPWGGLPRPAIIQTATSSDAMRQLFESWAAASGAHFVGLERSVDPRLDISERWWEEMPAHWDSFVDSPRLDLLEQELIGLIAVLEQITGRRFSETRFGEAMELANQQARLNRATRDLVAATVPAPVSIAETMPAVMIPQWHRGSVWARDAAQRLHDEVAERVRTGQAALADEQVRLMWLGRGLWSSLGLYQALGERHGAVFVWSMYLGLGADGYERRLEGQDPLRALAARFVSVGDELRMPTWSSAWHLQEARRHGIDGVVSLGEEDSFSVYALESAGIPVLSLAADNVDRRTWNEDQLLAEVGDFIERRVRPVADRRRTHDHH